MNSLRKYLTDPRTLGAIFFVAVLPFALSHHFGRYDVETDFFAEYGPYAERIRRGDLPEAFAWKGPGYHILLALVGIVIRDLFTAAKLLSLAAGAIFVGLTAHAARRAGGATAGLVAAMFTAVQPLVLLLSWSVGTDMVFAAMSLASLVLIFPRDGEIAWRPILFAGLLAGWAFLTRPNGIFLVPAAAAVLLLSRALPIRALATRLAAFTGLFLAPTALWLLVHRAIYSTWPKSLNYKNLAAAAFPELTSLTPDVYRETFETQFHSFGDVIRQKGWAILAGAVRNIPAHFTKDVSLLFGVAVTALMLAGIVLLRSRKDREAWWIPAAGLIAFLSLVPLYYEPRFGLFLSAPAAILAAGSLVDFRSGTWRSLSGLPKFVPLLVAIGVAGWTGAASYQKTKAQLLNERGGEPILAAAAVIRSRTDVAGAVAARKPHLAWHAGRVYAGIPRTALPGLPDTLRARGIGFIFYSIIEAEMVPEYFALTTIEGIPPGLKPVYIREDIPFGVLFEVLPTNRPEPATPETVARFDRLGQVLTAYGVRGRMNDRLMTDQYHRAVFLMSNKRYAEALPLLEQTVQLAPDFPEANMYLGHGLIEVHRFEEGLARLDHAVALGMSSPEIQMNRGIALAGLARIPEAETIFRDVLATNPDNQRALFNMGFIAAQRNQSAAAESLFEAAASRGYPFDTAMRTNLGQMKLQLGKVAEAETLLASGVRADPRSASLWLLYGFALLQRGKTEEARAAWTKVLEIDPQNAYAREYLSKMGG